MTQQKSPSGRNRKGIKKSITDREDNTVNPLGMQGFEASYPCRGCCFFQVVRFSSHKFRHQCGYSGQWLDRCGVHECTARQVKGGGNDAA